MSRAVCADGVSITGWIAVGIGILEREHRIGSIREIRECVGIVRSDGRVTLPFVNDVDAVGKTPVALASDIAASLKNFIVNPQVTVIVEDFTPSSISVLGEVSRPGPQVLLTDSGVADALSGAGGLTQFAHKDRIFVVRSRPQPIRIHFTYDALTKGIGRAPLFRLRAGDVIVVE